MNRSSRRRTRIAPTPAQEPVTAGRPGRRRLFWLLLALLLVVMAVGAWQWFNPATAPIPRPQLVDADVRFTAALDHAEDQVRRSPRAPEPWARLGALLIAHAFPSEAKACFQRAAELDQANWNWPFYQAIAEEYESQEQAARSLETALLRNPRAVIARVHLAELLTTLGRYEEAETQFRQVLQESPRHARACLGLARVLHFRDQPAAALEILAPALSHQCTRQAAHRCLAQIQQRQGQSAAAERTLASLVGMPDDQPWPGDPRQDFEILRTDRLGYAANALALQKAGGVQQAHELARQAETSYPELYFLVEGNMKLTEGDYPSAERALRQAVQLNSTWVEPLISLGRALVQQGKMDEAAGIFRQALKLEPSYGPAHLELGRCLRHTDPVQARAALEAAVQYMPLSASAHEELSNLLESQGQTAESRRHAQIAQRLKSQ